MRVKLPNNLLNEGVMTGEIGEKWNKRRNNWNWSTNLRLYWSSSNFSFYTVKNGENKSAQIEKGDLFDFEQEVEPIIKILTFKTLEENRMEVLEEEEIKWMKEQIQYFEKVRNRELEIVEKLEIQEIKREQEKTRRNIERDVRIEMNKIYQKKISFLYFCKKLFKEFKII